MSDSADKRSVTTDALETLGTIIGPNEKRDAIHIAVEPVTAKVKLYPGQDVAADGSPSGELVGIVDPFLKAPVPAGEKFWLLIYPRQIRSLRHVWSHPSFADEPDLAKENASIRDASEKWLREFCARADCPGYEAVMQALDGTYPSEDGGYYRGGVESYGGGESYLFFGGRDAHGDIPAEFWDHYYNVTGKRLANPPTGFSCSC